MDRLRCIEVFVEVARDGSFTGAARRLGMSKAATTKHVAWLEAPRLTRPVRLDRAFYERVKKKLVAYWMSRLSAGARLIVPETRVYDAERNLLYVRGAVPGPVNGVVYIQKQ